ncbi:hypothetical protein [Streptomyces decoyicus]|uniref:hypothetical protein n=1 Tax=Streptomyces decoyicus TaxID=249567 RepID=UPI00386435BD
MLISTIAEKPCSARRTSTVVPAVVRPAGATGRGAPDVGPFIFLVQTEVLAGIRMLTRHDLAPSMHEAHATDPAAIAATWHSYFTR